MCGMPQSTDELGEPSHRGLGIASSPSVFNGGLCGSVVSGSGSESNRNMGEQIRGLCISQRPSESTCKASHSRSRGSASAAVSSEEGIDTVSDECERAEDKRASKTRLLAGSRQSCVSPVCSVTPCGVRGTLKRSSKISGFCKRPTLAKSLAFLLLGIS